MKRTAAWRRHQKFRARNRALKILHHWTWGPQTTEDEIIDQAKHLADNLQSCSCHSCRNPRRSRYYKGKSKLTVQERRHLDDDFY